MDAEAFVEEVGPEEGPEGAVADSEPPPGAAGTPSAAPPPLPQQRAAGAKRPLLIGAGVIVVAAGLGLGMGLFLFGGGEGEAPPDSSGAAQEAAAEPASEHAAAGETDAGAQSDASLRLQPVVIGSDDSDSSD